MSGGFRGRNRLLRISGVSVRAASATTVTNLLRIVCVRRVPTSRDEKIGTKEFEVSRVFVREKKGALVVHGRIQMAIRRVLCV